MIGLFFDLITEIEKQRQELHSMACDLGIKHESVIAKSQELDQLIVKQMKLQKKSRLIEQSTH